MATSTRMFTFGGACVALTLLVTGCSPSAGAQSAGVEDCTPVAEVKTLKKGELTVLVAEHPPFVTNEQGTLSGIEGKLINKIAGDLCLKLNVKTTSFPAIIEGLQSGRADLSSNNWTVNDERRKLFEVSEGIYEGGMGLVSRGEGWSTVEDLKGRTIGTPQGYLWIDQLHKIYGEENVRQYQSDNAVLDEVAAGRIDVGAVSVLANTWRLRQDQYSKLTIEKMKQSDALPYTQQPPLSVVLMQKGNVALKDATNSILRDFYESGELEANFKEFGLDTSLVFPSKS